MVNGQIDGTFREKFNSWNFDGPMILLSPREEVPENLSQNTGRTLCISVGENGESATWVPVSNFDVESLKVKQGGQGAQDGQDEQSEQVIDYYGKFEELLANGDERIIEMINNINNDKMEIE